MTRLTNQSSVILSLYNSKWKHQLLKILCRDLRNGNINISIITATLEYFNDMHRKSTNKKGYDMKIINKFREIVTRPENQYNDTYDVNRAQRKVQKIKKYIGKNNSILDYGGNVGHFASAMGKYYNISPKRRFVIDILDWSGQKWKPRDDITFIEYKGQNPEEFNKQIGTVDIISAFHVLHHIDVNEREKIIDIFNAVLNKSGKIVLYEHDSKTKNKNMAFLLDLEHCLFDVVIGQSLTFKEFIKGFYAEYMSIDEWKKLFSKYFIPYKTETLNNANRSFYTYYKRV